MQPTIEILERMYQNSKSNKDEIFTRVYRYLQRPDLYFLAYKNLYANNGAATPGVDNDTADGFSEEKIALIIKALADGTYAPKPVRRTYIKKKQSNKMRPLGLPTFTDKLVQEVLRMVLEAIYEPIFCETSHGFRPKRSCHTALGDIKKGFNGVRWFVEGDIKGCFDSIDHNVLIGLIEKKIKDTRLLQLIRKFLKAGYMENWRYNTTHSGTPQGGIVSPILANIYLHELDKFVEELKAKFNKPQRKACYTPEYERLTQRVLYWKRKAKLAEEPERTAFIEKYNSLRAELLSTPSKRQTDKKIKYVRYADDFLIGVNGAKADCEWLKSELRAFIGNTLKMELSEEKTLITHSSQKARFLGYDVRIRRNGEIKRDKNGVTKRSLSQTVELLIPLKDKIERFMFDKGVIIQKDGKFRYAARPMLTQVTEQEIVTAYNSELRGICNYYRLACNYHDLCYFAYLMEYSCLKTLAAKHKTSTAKIIHSHQDGRGKWCITQKTEKGEKRLYFARYQDCRKSMAYSDSLREDALYFTRKKTSFEVGLKAKVCEMCGTAEAAHYEIHHVKKVKDLEGKLPWEKYLIARNRKTMVVCRNCHKEIHRQ